MANENVHAAQTHTVDSLPPVLLYLPGMSRSLANTSARVSELMALKASEGPGTYAVETVPSPNEHLPDGHRIIETQAGPVLEIYQVDYRDRMSLPDVTGKGASATFRRFFLAAKYFIRGLCLLLEARVRAKSRVARMQIVIGLGAVLILLLSVIFAGMAVAVSLGIYTEAGFPGTAAEIVALGLTAFGTWAFFNARPAVMSTAAQLEELMEYAENQRHAAGVAWILTRALDHLLENHPDRKVHIFGYSLGAQVAVDFLCPPVSLSPNADPRHPKAIQTLVTVGWPADFMRLYIPNYLEDRTTRVPGLRWTNIYIAADVFGSNLSDRDDTDEASTGNSSISVGGLEPTHKRYTNETLTWGNVWGRKGFLSHSGYWDEPERENCLHLVLNEVLNPPPKRI